MNRPSAIPTVQIDNEQVKVTRWAFPPNGETGWHRHEMKYVVIPLTTGPLLLETPEGETTSQLTTGSPYYRSSGRSEEHTSELQPLMRNSYAGFCLKKKIHKQV